MESESSSVCSPFAVFLFRRFASTTLFEPHLGHIRRTPRQVMPHFLQPSFEGLSSTILSFAFFFNLDLGFTCPDRGAISRTIIFWTVNPTWDALKQCSTCCLSWRFSSWMRILQYCPRRASFFPWFWMDIFSIAPFIPLRTAFMILSSLSNCSVVVMRILRILGPLRLSVMLIFSFQQSRRTRRRTYFGRRERWSWSDFLRLVGRCDSSLLFLRWFRARVRERERDRGRFCRPRILLTELFVHGFIGEAFCCTISALTPGITSDSSLDDEENVRTGRFNPHEGCKSCSVLTTTFPLDGHFVSVSDSETMSGPESKSQNHPFILKKWMDRVM